MVATRAVALVMALLSMALMISAKERGSLKIFGLEIPLYANWSFSDSLEYLVGMSAASAAYCLAQLVLIAHKAMRNAPVVQSRNYAWLLFTGDQYLMEQSVASTSIGSIHWCWIFSLFNAICAEKCLLRNNGLFVAKPYCSCQLIADDSNDI
uniref:CASP-like protein n=1 Tax=Oryza brachyantha TaxID=4533 RepID=J3L3N1_ORYBR